MDNIVDQVEFEIIEKIADGGMGAVYKALHKGFEGFEKVVAVKTLLPEYSTDEKFCRAFVNEAKLVANLVHENIVQIYHLGHANDIFYCVSEYVDGVSLRDFISHHNLQNVLFSKELAVFISSRIARGLAYAHSRLDRNASPLNIVHCDVCPHNILIDTGGLPKLADFGVARVRNSVVNDEIEGKLPYISPEQANRGNLDFRSDIYSLGVVLFNLLSGSFTRKLGEGVEAIWRQAESGFVDWDELPEDVDGDLMEILGRMLAPDPDDRYQKTCELARDLENYIYKDGYGPTIVTLSDYMRKQLPFLYPDEDFDIHGETEGFEDEDPFDKTTVLNSPFIT